MPLRSAKFWSNRAERARKIAEQMDELDARLAILEMARHYEILAENVQSSMLSIGGNPRTRPIRSDVCWASYWAIPRRT